MKDIFMNISPSIIKYETRPILKIKIGRGVAKSKNDGQKLFFYVKILSEINEFF